MGRCGVWGKGDGGRLGFRDEDTVFQPRVNEGLCVRRLALGGLHSVAVDLLEDVYSSFSWSHPQPIACGLVKKKEAEEQAKQIKSSAFQTANQHFEKESDGNRESDVQVYAKESSTLMVEAVKKGLSLKGDQESIPEYLNLSNKALGKKEVRAFGQLLASQAISQIVNDSPMLEDFICSSTRVGSEGGLALAEALGTCNNMKKLDIRDNMFGVEAGIALSQSIPDEGAIRIANGIKDGFDRLIKVDLSINDIRTVGASVLSQADVGKPGFKILNIDGNFLSDEGADHVREIFKNFLSVLGPLDENELKARGKLRRGNEERDNGGDQH
nr:hypothetical protein [Tanacetum cinerariifolium]